MIKNESELASVLGNAFAAYANRVQNGLTQPYKAFLDGAVSVDVTVTLQGDYITVKAKEQPVIAQVESIIMEPPVLEAQPVTEEEFEPCLEAEVEIIEKPEPKRKRKKII